MSWMEKLYETYQQGLRLDLPGDKLMPICHTLQNAHINIVIDGDGNFRHAMVVEKKYIMLPATERSASRGNGESPHALADKLQYIAKDYAAYGGKKNPYFESYQAQLKAWCESKFTHQKARAVYKYILKGRVVEDLINERILFVDESHHLLTSWLNDVTEESPIPLLFKVLPKEKGQCDQGSALVCWTVQTSDDPNQNTWTDESLQQNWILFSSLREVRKGLCYVTGEVKPLAEIHPAKLRHTGDKAKLISSNDTSGYTYRGRFVDETQASGVSFEVTQKAHNALSWLIHRQGYRNGDQVIVAWAISGKPIPELLVDSYALMSEDLDVALIDEADEEPHKLNYGSDLGESFALQLNKKMAGYRAELGDFESIIIMAIDSATPGRMGITYYRECLAKEYIDSLESWHLDFSWPQRCNQKISQSDGKKPKSTTIWPVSAPSPYTIAEALYGKTLTDSLKKNLYERLLPCILERRPIPIDIVTISIHRACNPLGSEHWEWERNLGVACALYRGFYRRQPIQLKRRDYSMSLEKENRSRDYLYGRLLAIAERIEQIALSVAQEHRQTTAERLMQRFADRPFSTWRNIELALKPYIQKLQNTRGGFLANQQKELDDIMSLFEGDEFTSDKKLSGEFLLAYHCQRQSLHHRPEHEPIIHS